MATYEQTEYLLADVDIKGVIHVEDGKLTVGDSDIATIAADAWGGKRQQGRVYVAVYVWPQKMTVSNPDLGVGHEASEPA